MVISGTEIALDQFHMMETRNAKRQKSALKLTLWSLVLGLLMVITSIFLLIGSVVSGGNSAPSGGAFIAFFLLSIISSALQILTLAGIFLYSFGRKRFDLKRYWNVSVKQGGAKE